ncbi:hypothetical protein ACLOJK_027753 [Asimina triloba]
MAATLISAVHSRVFAYYKREKVRLRITHCSCLTEFLTMSDASGSRTWREELASLVEDTGIRYGADGLGVPIASEREMEGSRVGGGGGDVEEDAPGASTESFKNQVKEFLKGSAELLQELGRGCRDIIQQSLGTEDSYVARKLGGPWAKVSSRLSFMNEYLPEDRDPVHAWPLSKMLVLEPNPNEHNSAPPLPKKVYIPPPSAIRVQLPDGRYISYQEQGVLVEKARISLIAPHPFLSSRLAGVPGIKASLLEEFGVRLITYDLPGFGESDPHPKRNLNSSALDMSYLATAVGVKEKFWVVGYSTGAMHAWAALRYIPDRIAGTVGKKVIEWILGQVAKYANESLIEEPLFIEFWERDVEESVRQWNPKPFVEEAVLQVSHWGFSLAQLQAQRARQGKGLLPWLKSVYSQGLDDKVVPPSMINFIQRVVPGATVHKLPGEGHFSYFYFCDECHRHVFSTLFGAPQGPLSPAEDEASLSSESTSETHQEETLVTEMDTYQG